MAIRTIKRPPPGIETMKLIAVLSLLQAPAIPSILVMADMTTARWWRTTGAASGWFWR